MPKQIDILPAELHTQQQFIDKPRHVALIPDGNRRWARRNGLSHEFAHRFTFTQLIPDFVEKIWDAGVHTVTVWFFSTENWKRSQAEIAHLMQIYEESLEILTEVARSHAARVIHLGRKDRIPESLRASLHRLEACTTHHDALQCNIALDYGGRTEVIDAFNAFLQRRKPDELLTSAAFEQLIGNGPFLYPDIVIRTAGATRTSGFMPWQTCYSELFFLEQFFPDITWEEISEVFNAYQHRHRTYGK